MDYSADEHLLSTRETQQGIVQLQRLLNDTARNLLTLCDASTPMSLRDKKQSIIDKNIVQIRDLLARPIGKDKVPLSQVLDVTLKDLGLEQFSIANTQCLQTLRQITTFGDLEQRFERAVTTQSNSTHSRFQTTAVIVAIFIIILLLFFLVQSK
jgi:hypothetical protein